LDIPANLFPDTYLWSCGVLCVLLMLAALLTAPWSKIRDSEAQHIFLGTIVMLSLLWVMRGGIQDGAWWWRSRLRRVRPDGKPSG
jgi:uncharacterized membrane protein